MLTMTVWTWLVIIPMMIIIVGLSLVAVYFIVKKAVKKGIKEAIKEKEVKQEIKSANMDALRTIRFDALAKMIAKEIKDAME